MKGLAADLHTHTVASGHAYSTIEEMAAQAKENGIKILGMTDHGPNLPGGPHIYHFKNLDVLPQTINGIRILKGVEANITDSKGSLDLPVSNLAKLDIVLAGFHTGTGYEAKSKAENTRAMINTIKNPLVDIIVHPGNPEYKINIEQVINTAQQENTLLEINNSSYLSRPGSKENCIEIAKKAKAAGSMLVLGTDSHYSDQIGKFDQALQIAKEAGLNKDDILNTSVEKVEEFIQFKNKIKKSI